MSLQLSEAWDHWDDWTGVAGSPQRRKIQNRLNQRAYRKRKHLKRLGSEEHPKLDAGLANAPLSCTLGQQTPGPRRVQLKLRHANVEDLPIFLAIKDPGLYRNVMEFMQRAFADWSINLLRLHDLPTLTRFNALDALMRNAVVMRIPLEVLETDDFDSLFNDPKTSEVPKTMPAGLSPTALQKAVTHHSWLDLFPIPGLRDNILRGIQAGELDEEQLSQELCCDLLNFDAASTAPLVIWGESWDAGSWEFSMEFFEKWGKLLRGCPEVLQATNYWRQKRGETTIEFVLK
ncbi:hypothetical protein GQ53DRAFT_837529 [Thozetella sp. PMI_491]|nr:hypothetical protein GQ53DRAFT_837529 [Thozetella sp. PMI_491]